jgi:hypothetical protein
MEKLLDCIFGEYIRRNKYCVIYKTRFLYFFKLEHVELFKNIKQAREFANKYEESEIRIRNKNQK